jgi:hypothetical protein
VESLKTLSADAVQPTAFRDSRGAKIISLAAGSNVTPRRTAGRRHSCSWRNSMAEQASLPDELPFEDAVEILSYARLFASKLFCPHSQCIPG